MDIKNTEEYKSTLNLLNKFDIKKEFLTYKQSLVLKELGLDEKSFCYYDTEGTLWQMGIPMSPNYEPMFGLFNPKFNPELVCAPTYSQAFRWFREKHNLHGNLWLDGDNYAWNIVNKKEDILGGGDNNGEYEYEEAESACLDKLIEILKNE